ncbi:hypothetical protein BD01_1306 [Thermococcus nautili]|uniref:Uncharacterized protein n=1 Tax=Thermococcus nautili TaxID=195522 RepID=W8NUS4_9EURY|nr:hypothetical protein BD01_1306 [Thermococcus nautili]
MRLGKVKGEEERKQRQGDEHVFGPGHSHSSSLAFEFLSMPMILELFFF